MLYRFLVALSASVFMAACGGSPTAPPPPPPPAPPPANAMPSITSIAAQGRRPGQPPRFADVRETIDVSATVTDAETPLDELVYQWSATAGTFSGSGRTVTWTAPETAGTPPGPVTLTLKVVENYGHPGQPKSYSQEVTRTETIALHDSVKEVGDMAVRFLTEFSKPQTNKDWQDIMKDFNRSACPRPGEFDDERESVINHYTNFVMNSYHIGQPNVTVNFGGSCAVPGDRLPGDACASVRVVWDSTGPSGQGSTSGIDHLSAIYAVTDSRWWLCSSRYEADTTFGQSFYSR